ncbi:Tyrosine--trna ligase [Fagus crenata]
MATEAPDQVPNQAPEQVPDQAPDQEPDQAQDQEPDQIKKQVAEKAAAKFKLLLDQASEEERQRYSLVRSVGEECLLDEELLKLLQKKPEPICYDGFEPSGRMHITQHNLSFVVRPIIDRRI